MTRRLLTRICRGVLWRLAWRSDVTVFLAGPEAADPPVPAGCALLRAGAADAAVTDAMRAAGERPELVPPRFAHGDECFGWASAGLVVSFGWVTFRDRRIGPTPFRDAPGRAFLYNFHTLADWRGRGLYPALLRHVRHALGREGYTHFVVEADDANPASRRGIEKAGFAPVARTSYLTLGRRWELPLGRRMTDPAAPPLF